MSFYTIKDPVLRDKKINELVDLEKKLKKRYFNQRVGYQEYNADLEEDYKPILKGQEKLQEEVVKQLQPLHNQLKTMLKQESDTSLKDNIVKFEEYSPLKKLLEQDNTVDKTFGICFEDGKFKIGTKEIRADDESHILIGEHAYSFTPGLWSLITEKLPGNYDLNDLNMYKEILNETEALYKDYDSTNSFPRSNKSKKWMKILKYIWKQIREDQGHDAETENDEEVTDGSGIGSEFIKDGKMFLRKGGLCYRVRKTHGNGIYLRRLSPYLLPGVYSDGLYLNHMGTIYHGEGLVLGPNSPFKNIPNLGGYFKEKY